MMIELAFTPEIIEELHHERFNHPHPRVQLKMEAMYLRGKGFSCKEVCDICKISKWTLINYAKDFTSGGVEALKKFDCRGRRSGLEKHASSLKEEFSKRPPHTASEAAERIAKLTGVKRKLTQVKEFLKNNGFKYRKAGHVPGKGCTEEKKQEQSRFLENELKPRLDEVKNGTRDLFFWMPLTSSMERS
jgi:transposase